MLYGTQGPCRGKFLVYACFLHIVCKFNILEELLVPMKSKRIEYMATMDRFKKRVFCTSYSDHEKASVNGSILVVVDASVIGRPLLRQWGKTGHESTHHSTITSNIWHENKILIRVV